MRRTFLEGCKSVKSARKLAPWAAVVAKVNGGYMVWESLADAETWSAQRRSSVCPESM